VEASLFAERLDRHLNLTAAERRAMESLESQERSYRRGTIVIGENETPRDLFIVRSGWLHSSVSLGDGSRQILHFLFPGDLVGLTHLVMPEAPETVTAVADVSLSPFPRERLAALYVDHPRLAALIFSLAVSDRVALGERLASIGRTSARARIATLIGELFARLGGTNGLPPDTIHIPLTQEDIGDATGLTAVHVNRMMRALATDGIIERSGHLLRLCDSDGLEREANYAPRPKLETGWLPPARD
jgi:CRP/FNR family transcriptional regulator, anaerobic regulatory protein